MASPTITTCQWGKPSLWSSHTLRYPYSPKWYFRNFIPPLEQDHRQHQGIDIPGPPEYFFFSLFFTNITFFSTPPQKRYFALLSHPKCHPYLTSFFERSTISALGAILQTFPEPPGQYPCQPGLTPFFPFDVSWHGF